MPRHTLEQLAATDILIGKLVGTNTIRDGMWLIAPLLIDDPRGIWYVLFLPKADMATAISLWPHADVDSPQNDWIEVGGEPRRNT